MADEEKPAKEAKEGAAPEEGKKEKKEAKGEKKGGGRPEMTPEQEAEAAKKKAARAEGKGKGKGGGKGAAGGAHELAQERVKRAAAARLRTTYEKDLRPRLMQELGLKNPMEVPRVSKVVINMGLGEAINNPKVIDSAVEELALISGQKPVVTVSRKSIANFKLRQGQKIGAMVTLRRDTMWEFLDRLINFALPRVRDFKGVSPKAFDGRGNYTLGVREGMIFPEASFEKMDKAKGMNITITTTARTDEQGRALLKHLGMPFRS
jgi:large subunit ribosomal protein L5